METHTIISRPDPGQPSATHLTVEIPADTQRPQRMIFEVHDGTALRRVFAANIAALFRIRFRKYDLNAKRMFWGYLEYAPAARPVMAWSAETEELTLTYKNVAGRIDTNDPRPPEVPAGVPKLPAPTAIDPIDVTVILGPATRDLNHGWINFDIRHQYPTHFDENPARFAWEETLHYPIFDFSGAAQELELQSIAGSTLKFSAIWTPVGQDLQTAAGIAVHCEDQEGHDTTTAYDPERHTLTHTLRNSIHLQAGVFKHKAKYRLSLGDAFGFGGNAIIYRLRAFLRNAPCPDVPVTWHDAAEVYRSWLQRRYAGEAFYREFLPRTSLAPVDTMAPHTVIANFGLDGSLPPGKPFSADLELHPALNHADAGRPPSLAMLAGKLRERFTKDIEVQLWGIELAGFYQFLGGRKYLSDVLDANDPNRIATAIAQLAAAGAATTITTDPLNVLFNRGRFAGNIRWKGGVWNEVNLQNAANWTAFIAGPFHPNVVAAANALTKARIGNKDFDRIWFVDDLPGAGDGHARRIEAAQKRDPWQLSAILPAVGSGMYRGTQKQICPTDDVMNLYIDEWVRPRILTKGARVVEFMKHPPHQCFCYRTDHAHIDAQDGYDNVIGAGSWYVRRVKALLERLQLLRPAPQALFRVAHEFEPAQPLMPYVDQYYSGSEVHAFVYSHMATPMLSPGRDGGGTHPGYREVTRDRALPTFMLAGERDETQASFEDWRKESVDYSEHRVKVQSWGVAPRAYPTGPRNGALVAWKENDPLAPTNPPTYTYNRCVQQTFNLRADIFANGIAAVRGVRLMIPSSWVEEPTGYDAIVLDHAVLAARLQMEHSRFFRFGRMLGETKVNVNGASPRPIWAWTSDIGRSFHDVKPLVDRIGADDVQLGIGWRERPLRDFISRAWDKLSEEVKPIDARQIEHRVWEHVEGNVRRVLYAFANVSNTQAHVQFVYGRGLEGTSTRTPLRRTIHIIGGTSSDPAPVWLGKREESLHMAPRSFAAVVVEP